MTRCNIRWPHEGIKGLKCKCYKVSWWNRVKRWVRKLYGK